MIRALENTLLWRVAPKEIRMNNAPELISKHLESCTKEKQIELLYIQTANKHRMHIERFNHTFREDVLDAYLLDHLDEVHLIAERWLEDYNTIHPHKTFQDFSPRQYAIQNACFVYLLLVYKMGT